MEENSEKTVKPRGTPFPEGKSGNPNGRPKGQRNYETIYREAMIMLAEKNGTTPELLEAEMIANGAVLARKGDYRFYKDTLDRLHGTAVQKSITEITLPKPITDVFIQSSNSNEKDSSAQKEN